MIRGRASEWMALCNASWSEGARARAAELDVEHILAGIAASGGETARILGRAGVTLAGLRAAAQRVRRRELQMLGVDTSGLTDLEPRPVEDLHHDATGDIAVSDRYERLLLGKASSASVVLGRVIDEPSGRGREVLEEAGADLDLLRRGLDSTDAPGRPWRVVPARRDLLGDGPLSQAVQVRSFVSSPPEVVADVASGAWFEEARLGAVEKKGYRFRPELVTRAGDGGRHRVVWVTRVSGGRRRLDAVATSYADITVTPAPGGSDVTLAVAHRIWGGVRGRLVSALVPSVIMSRMQVWNLVRGLTLKSAEVADG